MISQPSPKYYVVGMTHIDLAWKRHRDEYSEMEEIFAIRLLDALETHPSFTYVLEQAHHLRTLAERRPDLFQRLKRFVQQGRLEVLGGMVSTMEINMPGAESLVRNQLLGLEWVQQNFGVEVETAYLIDTFGLHAQLPQILRQFGFRHLLANRFGAAQSRDVFQARGLDGSQVLVAGRDVHSAYVRPEHIFFEFIQNWNDIDRLFAAAASASGTGPCLVVPYTENEYLVSLRPLDHVKENNRRDSSARWVFATPRQFFQALEAARADFPVVHADLNPEFTGTFSNRVILRLRNRAVENWLLEAEQWACLLGLKGWQPSLTEAWWSLAYNHFHDVFTGSHPSRVFEGVMANFDAIEQTASTLVAQAAAQLAPITREAARSILVLNRLPFSRREVFSLPLPQGGQIQGIRRVQMGGQEVPFEVRQGTLHVLADLPPAGVQSFQLETATASAEQTPSQVSEAVLENDHLRLECDALTGIRRLTWKATGESLWSNAGDLLVLQQDDGGFQIEDPCSSEVPAAAGEMQLLAWPDSSLGGRLLLRGAFPALSWAGENPAGWEAELSLLPDAPGLRLSLRISWQAERARLRLKLATNLNTGEGIFEIPFGVVGRRAYGVRGNSRGEWPAQRFVALEDGRHGLALVNSGVPGVEVGGGTLWTTLLRAPYAEYSGMARDDTSSQHGEHRFDFLLLAYQGSWVHSGVIRWAQAWNSPLRAFWAGIPAESSSWMRLEPENVVLSCVKAPQDGAEELVVRFYETAGQPSAAHLWLRGARQAWHSNLKEEKLTPIACAEGEISVEMRPFEIKTLRIQR